MKKNERSKMTFPQLWKDLRKDEETCLRVQLTKRLHKATDWRPTLCRWYQGKNAPQSYAEQALVAEVINEVLGISTDAGTLFPNNK